MKILIVDTYYPQFLDSWQFGTKPPEAELEELLHFSFGTGDFYSRNLRALGWEAEDYIANSDRLRGTLRMTDPDVIFMQDLSIDPPVSAEGRILAGQCSCPMPPESKLRRYDVIFTSFPHYVKRFLEMGIRAVYNPLAFDPIVLERAVCPRERIYDCVFIGGVGAPSHWRRGMEVLETVAREIPSFLWWGYGIETLSTNSPLRPKYRGPAWGLDMYKILLQSKICINRHGEVAEGYANNMRMFEATGCGAMLLTEDTPNLDDFFDFDEVKRYTTPENAVRSIRDQLERDWPIPAVNLHKNGQARTLRDHTYARRMQTISETLKGMLCPA